MKKNLIMASTILLLASGSLASGQRHSAKQRPMNNPGITAPVAATATILNGFYVKGLGGKGMMQVNKVDYATSNVDKQNFRSTLHLGFGGGVRIYDNFSLGIMFNSLRKVNKIVLGTSPASTKYGYAATTTMLEMMYEAGTGGGAFASPYAIFGIGMAKVKFNYSNSTVSPTVTKSQKINSLAFTIGLGLGINLTENFILDLGYRFTSIAKGGRGGDIGFKQKNLRDNSGEAGFRFKL